MVEIKLKRISQEDVPLESLVAREKLKGGDWLMVEKESHPGLVSVRMTGFYVKIHADRVVLSSLYPEKMATMGREAFLERYGLPWDTQLRLDEITHYYHIPRSEFTRR